MQNRDMLLLNKTFNAFFVHFNHRMATLEGVRSLWGYVGSLGLP